jgi:FdhD protein
MTIENRSVSHERATPAGLPWPILRFQQNEAEPAHALVALEEPLEVIVNGQSIAVLMRLPGNEKELAAGFLITEGYVRQAADILLIHHCGSGYPAPGEDVGGESTDEGLASRNQVSLRVLEQGFRPPARPDVLRLIRSGCGAAEVTALAETLPPLPHSTRLPAARLPEMGRAMRDLQVVHRQIGGVHAAAVFDPTGRAITLAEDIGRHNAMDKAIGHCLLRGLGMHDKTLITSGRASYEMVTKAIRTGIPIVASASAPTSLAVQLAHDRGLTLIGYLRGSQMNVYTHPDRLT